MLNLIKAELYRFFKSKYCLILAIVGAALALFVPLLQFVLKASISSIADAYGVQPNISFSALSCMQSSLNPGSIYVFIVSIIIVLILLQDYRNGTIRNKIICGISRFKIYSTYYLVSSIFLLALVLGNGLLTFLFSLPFFPAGCKCSFVNYSLRFLTDRKTHTALAARERTEIASPVCRPGGV